MKILNIGSLNLDYVYRVDHIIVPGETQTTFDMQTFCGGKGLNQSIALAKAGAKVYHGGVIGEDGEAFLNLCKENGIDTSCIKSIPGKSGHTIIQVDKNAQNCILLYGGANRSLTREYVDEVLSHFDKEDILLLQNEVNQLDYIIDRAYEKGMTIVLNPSPFDDHLSTCDLSKISLFLMNEIEGEQITKESEPDIILQVMAKTYPNAKVVLTLGKDGAIFFDGNEKYRQEIFEVKAVDTTAAGDTFTGYFLAGMLEGLEIAEILRRSAKASAIAVTRDGAVASIPTLEEVKRYIFNQ